MTKRKVTTKTPRTKRADASVRDQPVDAEIRRAAERAGIHSGQTEQQAAFQREVVEPRRRRYLAALSSIVSGGLAIEGDEPSGGAEAALLHVLGAQLKAVMLSLTSRSTSTDTGPTGWILADEEMTDSDLMAALSGIVAVAQSSRLVIEKLRATGDLVDEDKRFEWEQEEQATAGGAS